MSRKVYVFTGFGVNGSTLIESLKRACQGDPNLDVVEITSQDMKEMGRIDPATVAAFFLPGGAKPQYDQQIGQHGFGLIREYVREGGAFYGICAGAYYASRELDWQEGTAEHKHKWPGLGFFNGLAKGPERSLITHNKEFGQWYDAAIVDITPADTDVKNASGPARVLYWDGPIFHSPDNFAGNEVLATIQVQGQTTPAIIKVPNGKGFAILSSVHPETSAAQLAPHINTYLDSSTYVRVLYDELAPFDAQRENIWRAILAHAPDMPVDAPENASAPLQENTGQSQSDALIP